MPVALHFQRQGPDWFGHMYKYPPDHDILNGQWSVFLHVKDFLGLTGSQSSVVYRIEEEDIDVFMGWMVPFHQGLWNPTVYAEMNKASYWSKSVDYMQMKVDGSDLNCESRFKGGNDAFKVTASIGNDFSPQVNYVVSVV